LPEEIIGKTVREANPIVIEILKAHALCGLEKLSLSAPQAGLMASLAQGIVGGDGPYFFDGQFRPYFTTHRIYWACCSQG
jgi:hypothetical protein